MFDVITIGSAVKDRFLFLDSADAPVIDNPYNDPKREKLIALEFGAKIDVKKFTACFGGGALNSAITFARADLKASAVISIGEDEAGKEIQRIMKKEKIASKFVKKLKDVETGLSTIIVAGEAKHDRVILIERGASDHIDFPESRFKAKAKWYYLTALSGKNWKRELSKICDSARKKHVKLAWNPGSSQLKQGLSVLQKFMLNCEVFIVNRDEALDLVHGKNDVPRLLRALLEKGPRRVIISDGINGAYYADKDQNIHAKANKALKAKEPTGAGDAFGSGFVASLIKNPDDIKSALDNGIKNSESVIQKTGAQEGIIKIKI